MALNIATFKTRAATSGVFVAVMLLGLLWNHWSFFILFSIIHFGCWYEFIELLKALDAHYPAEARIRVILDNHSAHISKETQRHYVNSSYSTSFSFTARCLPPDPRRRAFRQRPLWRRSTDFGSARVCGGAPIPSAAGEYGGRLHRPDLPLTSPAPHR